MTFEKVKEIIVETISCDEDKITLDASLKDDLGIAMIVNPEQEMANEIFNLINLPSVAQIEHFAKTKGLKEHLTNNLEND